jgi:hypothetical protein
MPAEAFRSRVAHAAAAPAVPPGAVAELEAEGADDADAAPVGLGVAAEDAAEAEDAGAAGAGLLEDEEELQPAASVAARSAPPVNSPRWVRTNGVIP